MSAFGGLSIVSENSPAARNDIVPTHHLVVPQATVGGGDAVAAKYQTQFLW